MIATVSIIPLDRPAAPFTQQHLRCQG